MELFDKQERLMFLEIDNGSLVLKNKNGIKPSNNKIICSKGLSETKIRQHVIDNCVDDCTETLIRKKCKCGHDICILKNINESYVRICKKCKAFN
jgi:hypothetical protein